jgi:hypothetical protein
MQQIAEGLDPCAAQYVRLIKRAAELAGSPSNTPEGVELAAIRVWLGVYEDMHGLPGAGTPTAECLEISPDTPAEDLVKSTEPPG